MKLALFLSLFLSFNLDLEADEIQDHNSVRIHHPQHHGISFLALSSYEAIPDKDQTETINRRAETICKKMGYGQLMAKGVTYGDKKQELLILDMDGRMILTTDQLRREPNIIASYLYFNSIVCSNPPQAKNNEIIKKLLLEISSLKEQLKNISKEINNQKRSANGKKITPVKNPTGATNNTESK